MTNRARVLRRLVAKNLALTLAYRGAFFILMLSTVISPLVSLLIWRTVIDHGVRLPLDRSQFVTYYVLLGLVSMLTGVWQAPYTAETIRLGRLSPELLRPAPVILQPIANNLGEKIVKLPLLLPIVVGVALLFDDDFRPPTDPLAWLLFVLSLPAAAAINFLLDYLVGLLAFWLDDVGGLIRVLGLVRGFLAGRLVPLALFPPSFGPLLEAQPFRYTLSFPLEVVTGALDAAALLRGFGWQVVWLIILIGAYRAVWRRGLRLYSSVGG
ncbi:MAG TPA: ABC-2 family transporter protein [Chloroflexota bacterium]|jgi:ABC-2 type transport system permease protein